MTSLLSGWKYMWPSQWKPTLFTQTCILKNMKSKNYLSNYNYTTWKYSLELMGPAISEGSFKPAKTIYHLTCLAMERLKMFCFCSLNVVGVTCVHLQCCTYEQNHCRFLGKTATIDKCAVSLRVISIAYLILDWPISDKHFKPNPSTVDKCKQKLWLWM